MKTTKTTKYTNTTHLVADPETGKVTDARTGDPAPCYCNELPDQDTNGARFSGSCWPCTALERTERAAYRELARARLETSHSESARRWVCHNRLTMGTTSYDFDMWGIAARQMTDPQLDGAIVDGVNTALAMDTLDRETGQDRGGYYRDQLSVYRKERSRRENAMKTYQVRAQLSNGRAGNTTRTRKIKARNRAEAEAKMGALVPGCFGVFAGDRIPAPPTDRG